MRVLTPRDLDADALIKCFASAVSTGILLYLSPILFGTVLGDLVIIGAGLTFFASWLYISRPAPQKKNQTTDRGPQSNNRIFAAISGIFEVSVSKHQRPV